MKKLILLLFLFTFLKGFGQINNLEVKNIYIKDKIATPIKMAYSGDTLRIYFENDSVNFYTDKSWFVFNKKIQAPLYMQGDDILITYQGIIDTTWEKLKIDTIQGTNVHVNGDLSVPANFYLNSEHTCGFGWESGEGLLYIIEPSINSGNPFKLNSFLRDVDTTTDAYSRKIATRKLLADTAAAIRADIGSGSCKLNVNASMSNIISNYYSNATLYTFCNTDDVTYTWSGPGAYSGSDKTTLISSSGLYRVIVDKIGCSSDTAEIYVPGIFAKGGTTWDVDTLVTDTINDIATKYDLTQISSNSDSSWNAGKFGTNDDTIVFRTDGTAHYNYNGVDRIYSQTNGSFTFAGDDGSSAYIVGHQFVLNFNTFDINDAYGNTNMLKFNTNGNLLINSKTDGDTMFVFKNDGGFEMHSAISGSKVFSLNENGGLVSDENVTIGGDLYYTDPHANLYRNTDTTIDVTQNLWYKFGPLTSTDVHKSTFQRDSVQLTKAGSYWIEVIISFSGLNNEVWEMAVFKNSVMVEPSQLEKTVTTDTKQLVLKAYVTSDGTDWFTFKIRNITDNDDPTISRIFVGISTEHLTAP